MAPVSRSWSSALPADYPRCLLARGLAGAETGPGEPAAVLIAGGRIQAVGEAALAADAPQQDLGDLWLSPGLLDAHVHLCMRGEPEYNLARNLKAGVVAVRDLGNSPKRARPQGPPQGPPLVVASGPGLCAPGEASCWLAHKVVGAAEMEAAARRAVAAGAQVIKLFATGLLDFDQPGLVQHPQALSREEARAAGRVAREHGLSVAIHGSGPDAAELAAACGAASLEHGFFLDDAHYDLLAQAGVRLVPTITPVMAYVADPAGRLDEAARQNLGRIAELQMAGIVRARARGVELVLGTDAGAYGTPHGDSLHREIHWWLEAGIPPEEVFDAATSRAADLLGLAGEVGGIAPGARDWLLGVGEDPRVNPRVLSEPVWVNI